MERPALNGPHCEARGLAEDQFLEGLVLAVTGVAAPAEEPQLPIAANFQFGNANGNARVTLSIL